MAQTLCPNSFWSVCQGAQIRAIWEFCIFVSSKLTYEAKFPTLNICRNSMKAQNGLKFPSELCFGITNITKDSFLINSKAAFLTSEVAKMRQESVLFFYGELRGKRMLSVSYRVKQSKYEVNEVCKAFQGKACLGIIRLPKAFPRRFKAFQGIPMHSNAFQCIPRHSKAFQGLPRPSNIYYINVTFANITQKGWDALIGTGPACLPCPIFQCWQRKAFIPYLKTSSSKSLPKKPKSTKGIIYAKLLFISDKIVSKMKSVSENIRNCDMYTWFFLCPSHRLEASRGGYFSSSSSSSVIFSAIC